MACRLIDEVHQDSFLGIPALVAQAPQQVLLFADRQQEHCAHADACDLLSKESAMQWAMRSAIPTLKLPETSRYGEMITGALRATGDCPDARSSSSAPGNAVADAFRTILELALGVAVPQCAQDTLATIQVFLPAQAGGAECQVCFLYVLGRASDDQTYAGNHLLSSAWPYVALTRASTTCYVLLEELTAAPSGHDSRKAKIQRWSKFLEDCKEVFAQIGVQHHYAVSDQWNWPSKKKTRAEGGETAAWTGHGKHGPTR
eukprot:Skav222486  [mRNA]  locus=scaffold1835:9314:10285:+ [translate_table: standard]